MRTVATMLLALVLITAVTPITADAQPALITVEDCAAFEITALHPFCCYAFTLCIENVALPPVDGVELVMHNATHCVPPVAPDGWDVDTVDPSTIEWEADPGDEIPPGVTLCGFGFSSNVRTVNLTITLFDAGVPTFASNFEFTCGEDCNTPVEPGTWGLIKALYTD
jgi:hypothetical protein